MSDYINLQSRCQRGESSISGANNLLAECHAALGKLIAENERFSKGRTDWQAESLKRGFTYCRESDDHYVLADAPEMADLLGLLLGVEVRDRENDSYGDTVSSLTEQVDAGIDAYRQAYEAEKERDQLKTENEALRQEVELDDKLIADRDRLLNMFECPDHGQCIPYAMEQVEALRKDAERYEWICANACDLNFYAAGPAPIRGRVEIDAEQYPVSEWGSAKPELDSIIDAAMGKGDQT